MLKTIFSLFYKCTIISVAACMVLISSCEDKEIVMSAKKNFSSTGKLIFWTAANNFGKIDVYVQGSLIGSIRSFSSTVPGCDAIGFVTISRPSGSYSFQAFSINKQWTGTINIDTDCNSIKLQ